MAAERELALGGERGDVQRGLRGGGGNVDLHSDRAGGSQAGAVDLQVGDAGLLPLVVKSRVPSSSLRPWKVVTFAMRSMASSEESTCSWLAAICSSLSTPLLAASAA